MAAAVAAVLAGVGPIAPAQAASLSVSGVTVIRNETAMYYATGCCQYWFSYVNGSPSRLLRIGIDLLRPLGDVIDWESEIGIDSGVSGVWSLQICNHEIKDFGLGPYTLILSMEMYNGSSQEVNTPFYFARRPSVPGTPPGVKVTAADGQATITWNPSASEGSTPTTVYIVTSTPDDRTCVTSALVCTITGLTNGVSYTVTVQARNSVGDSFRSFRSDPVVPGHLPA